MLAATLGHCLEPESLEDEVFFCFASKRKNLCQREEHLCCMNGDCQKKKKTFGVEIVKLGFKLTPCLRGSVGVIPFLHSWGPRYHYYLYKMEVKVPLSTSCPMVCPWAMLNSQYC